METSNKNSSSTTIEFQVDFTTEFGAATNKRKIKTSTTAEETFKNCLKKLPKKIEKTWESIEFPFGKQTFKVSRHWLHETNFNWELSHETEPIFIDDKEAVEELFEQAVAQSKKEIGEEIASGRIPANEIKTFSDLHDYVDANEFGGFCEDGYVSPSDDFENRVQDAIDQWIKSPEFQFEFNYSITAYLEDGQLSVGLKTEGNVPAGELEFEEE